MLVKNKIFFLLLLGFLGLNGEKQFSLSELERLSIGRLQSFDSAMINWRFSVDSNYSDSTTQVYTSNQAGSDGTKVRRLNLA